MESYVIYTCSPFDVCPVLYEPDVSVGPKHQHQSHQQQVGTLQQIHNTTITYYHKCGKGHQGFWIIPPVVSVLTSALKSPGTMIRNRPHRRLGKNKEC